MTGGVLLARVDALELALIRKWGSDGERGGAAVQHVCGELAPTPAHPSASVALLLEIGTHRVDRGAHHPDRRPELCFAAVKLVHPVAPLPVFVDVDARTLVVSQLSKSLGHEKFSHAAWSEHDLGQA